MFILGSNDVVGASGSIVIEGFVGINCNVGSRVLIAMLECVCGLMDMA